MMNIVSQISDHSLKSTTKLELHELVLGNMFYIIIFLMLVVFVLKEKCLMIRLHYFRIYRRYNKWIHII